jgi:hypothetical protein
MPEIWEIVLTGEILEIMEGDLGTKNTNILFEFRTR